MEELTESGRSVPLKNRPGFTRPSELNIRWVHRSLVAVALVVIAVALHADGAKEFRDDPAMIILLTLVGAAVLTFAQYVAFPWFGLSYRDEALERRNSASLVAFSGAWLALACIYAGGNLGEGPSYVENIFSVALPAAGWLVLWALLEIGTNISLSIAEERDLASGFRLGGFLLASGLVLARAAAGDWHSVDITLHDFIHDGWFALVICAVALVVGHFTKPSRRHPFPSWMSHGLLPAIVYLGLGIAWLWHLGPWEGFLW